jgi:hypothetical protein
MTMTIPSLHASLRFCLSRRNVCRSTEQIRLDSHPLNVLLGVLPPRRVSTANESGNADLLAMKSGSRIGSSPNALTQGQTVFRQPLLRKALWSALYAGFGAAGFGALSRSLHAGPPQRFGGLPPAKNPRQRNDQATQARIALSTSKRGTQFGALSAPVSTSAS